MPRLTLDFFLNLGIAAAAVVVLVSWIRHRAGDRTVIQRAEISEDLAAADELLEDVIKEHQTQLMKANGSGTAGTGS